MTEPPGGATPHVVVEDLGSLDPDADTWHHLTRVLRARPGAVVTATDGRGRWRTCRITSEGSLEPEDEIVAVPRPEPEITVAFALTKGDKPELAVQKLTELGVDRIVPFVGERSVVRWEAARAARQVDRWRAVARAAAMQSKRVHLPRVDEVVDFATASALPGAALAERAGAPPSLDHPAVLVGPEGGWSDAELAAPVPRIGLGPHVLRAETAAVTVAALLTALRAGVVRAG